MQQHRHRHRHLHLHVHVHLHHLRTTSTSSPKQSVCLGLQTLCRRETCTCLRLAGSASVPNSIPAAAPSPFPSSYPSPFSICIIHPPANTFIVNFDNQQDTAAISSIHIHAKKIYRNMLTSRLSGKLKLLPLKKKKIQQIYVNSPQSMHVSI